MTNCELRIANCAPRITYYASRITYYVLVLGLLLAPLTASAEGISVIESKAEHSFAQQITFTLRATSDAEITGIYLFFRAMGDDKTRSVHIEDFEPGREVSASYTHDMRRFPLPPFARVNFWWQIEDSAGNQLTTEPQQLEYTDNRFRWEQISDGNTTVHWVKGHGDPAFGQAALDIARTSREEIEAELHTPPTKSIAIYIYDAQHNLDAAMLLTGREWVVGQAHPELGVVIVAIPYEEGYTSRMARYIPHEITHLLVYQAVTPAGYRYVPEWLDEGLAMSNERLPTPEFALTLEEARAAGELLPLDYLCAPFPPDSHTTFLAYAQSGSVVRFIRERYGAEKIRALLAAYASGASCTSGVQDTLNVSLSGLETAWRASLEPRAPWRAWADQIGIWVGLWLLSLLMAAPMIGKLRS
ncbi:MAG: peptidase MA family metallohydrolase [Chloroflexota bacterium]|nr:peptidase MA family metallohydrolase [Chloroflexota bacterium]